MSEHCQETRDARRLAIAVRGVVQGVGFRPFVYNAARARRLAGWVLNEADQVRIEVEGDSADLDAFVDALRRDHPPQARIVSLDVQLVERQASENFEIRTSNRSSPPRPTIPADLATCPACLAEIRDPGERRYGYPFTNCTNCGPRWSIIERLPYDRPRTSMAPFAMCDDCRAEYDDPGDRRFHAQPIACPRCGPTLQSLDAAGRETAVGREAMFAAVDALRAGKIVALKGLGGFQLLVDATRTDAVVRLRARKQRPDRPLAVLIRSVEEVRRRCEVSPGEAAALSSHEAPILLLRRHERPETADVSEAVAPGNPYLGVMLPYTPLHHLLMDALARPIVCTSGNLSEEPMATAIDDALERLAEIADVFLTHDRPIIRPVDDSVARIGPDGPQVLRRARGFSPLPIELGASGQDFTDGPIVLAVGGHLKNTVALRLGNQVVLSPHVGDLEHRLSVEVHRRAVRDLVEFFDAKPDVVACDLHPDYASTRHAETLAAEWGAPLVRVQHHHAHVAACMAEHGLRGPVLGLAWDGTGYGTDGAVWGGEALLCEGDEFVRLAHLRTFGLPGGDRAVREPRRSALGLLFEVFGDGAATQLARFGDPAHAFRESEARTLLAMLMRGVRCPRTSSMGRLFDAVAALCGLPAEISFEGQAAMALEFAADGPAVGASADDGDAYPLPLSGDAPAVADWEPLVQAVLADRAAGVPVGRISLRFHHALAELAVAVAERSACRQVALTGGCFQNALLTSCVRARLLQKGFSVYTHQKVPPGDGGIALGQAYVAAKSP
jgi:hydrogenase maturation protein HypF